MSDESKKISDGSIRKSKRTKKMTRMDENKVVDICIESQLQNCQPDNSLEFSVGNVMPKSTSTPTKDEDGLTWAVLGDSTFVNNQFSTDTISNIHIRESTDNFHITRESDLSDPYAPSESEYYPSTSNITIDASDECSFDKLKLSDMSGDNYGKKTSDKKRVLKVILQNISAPKNLRATNHSTTNCSHSNPRKMSSNGMNKHSKKSSVDKHDVENYYSDESDAIQITCSTKSSRTDKRIRDKRYCCLICQKIVINLPRHLTSIHSNELAVAKILAMPKNSRNRRLEFAKISREGNFYHNCEVIQTKHGEMILLRRPTEAEKRKYTYIDYGPCPDCLGFMLKSNISAHIKRHCHADKKKNETRKPISESNSLLAGIFGSNVSAEFTNHIIGKMRTDEVTKVCREDDLILKLGAMMFEKYHSTQAELIRQTMRQLGRLLLEMRHGNRHIKTLKEAVQPANFDIVVLAVKKLCSSCPSKTSRPQFGIPSLALKLGHSLRKCANIERGIALRNGQSHINKKMESFLSLMDIEWNTRISSNALNTLYQRKLNCTQLLPITSDLIKLNEYLKSGIENHMREIQKTMQPTLSTWTSLATLVLSRVVIFNKRRSGETARMTVEHYTMRPLWAEQSTQELKQSLTGFEKELAEKMCMVEIPGKRGKKVPVLLTPDVKQAIDLLIQTRIIVGVSKDNPYLFARSGTNLEYMRGHDCLRKCLSELDLEAPENITGTKLRKYVATVTQIINLSENETDWLARHLGHDIRVHRDFYRLHESAVELTKISRLLIAVDSGETNKFAGKKLDEIQLTDLPHLEEEAGEDPSVDAREADGEITKNTNKDMNSNATAIPSMRAIKKRDNKKKQPWDQEEKSAVLGYFKSSIRRGAIPGKAECEKCQVEYPILSHRKWTDLKFFVKNYLTKIRK